jgi:hypothetical protein
MKESITNKNLVFCNNYLAGCSCWLMMLCDCILILEADLVLPRSNILTMPEVKLRHVGSKVTGIDTSQSALNWKLAAAPAFIRSPTWREG